MILFQQDNEIENDSFVEPPIHVGIATGNIFSGFVGNHIRREIAYMGEVIDRAVLLMHISAQRYGKIYVDFMTK